MAVLGQSAVRKTGWMRSRSASIVLVVYVAALGFLVLWPTHPDALWQPFTVSLLQHFAAHPGTSWISYEVLNDITNLVLFLPVGLIAILSVGSRRWWLVFLLGCVGAAGVEVLQALFLPGRVADISDAVFGAIGVLVGVGFGVAIVALRGRRRA